MSTQHQCSLLSHMYNVLNIATTHSLPPTSVNVLDIIIIITIPYGDHNKMHLNIELLLLNFYIKTTDKQVQQLHILKYLPEEVNDVERSQSSRVKTGDDHTLSHSQRMPITRFELGSHR